MLQAVGTMSAATIGWFTTGAATRPGFDAAISGRGIFLDIGTGVAGIKAGARIVRHGRSITFQMAEVMMVSCVLFQQILAAIAALRSVRCRQRDVEGHCRSWSTGLSVGEVRPNDSLRRRILPRAGSPCRSPAFRRDHRAAALADRAVRRLPSVQDAGIACAYGECW
jgi:hypothetical protein